MSRLYSSIIILLLSCFYPAAAINAGKNLQDPVANRQAAAANTLTFPHTVNGQLGSVKYQSNIFLLNNSAASAHGMVYLYKQDGSAMTVNTNKGRASSFAFTLPPGATYRLETDGLGPVSVGWIEVTSDIPLSGSGSFVVFDSAGNFQTEVGIGDSVRGRELMLYVDSDQNRYTSYAVCNPSPTTVASLTFELRSLDGSVIATKTGIQLNPRGQRAEFVTQTFAEKGLSSFSGVLVIKSPDLDIAVTTLRSRGTGLTSLPSAPLVSNTSSSGTLLFSRIADGLFGTLKYQTSFILLNNSARPATASIEFTADTGTPLSLNIGGNRRSTLTTTIPARGALELVSDGGSNPAATGWASVKSDIQLAGCALFTSSNASSGAFVEQVGVPDSPLTSRATIYGQVKDDIDTAFALNNPADASQDFKLRLIRQEGAGGSGVILSEKTLTLGAKRHTAMFTSGFFSEVPDIQRRYFEGWIEIESSAGKTLNALTLRTRGASLTSLPVALRTEASDRYTVQSLVPATTTSETKGPVTLTASSKTASLSDGTSVALSDLTGSNSITLSLKKESNTVNVGSSQLSRTGSMRVLQIDAISHGALDSFNWGEYSPVLTIPAKEVGSIDTGSIQIVRTGPDPVTGAEVRNLLTARRDTAGNLVFKDPWLPDDLFDGSISDPGGLVGSPQAPAAYPKSIKYTPVTVQSGLNYNRESMLVRMVPDGSVPAKRKPWESLSPAEQQVQKKKPVQNVIVLVHGHNEVEKGGIYQAEVERPWYFQYKRDVWTNFYDTYNTSHRSKNCATVFYEFIYPSYRAIFGEQDRQLAALLQQELAPQLTNGLKFNLFVVSHSMGGLVSRAGFQQFDSKLVDNLRRFVSWGSPHAGASLYTLRFAITSDTYGTTSWLNWYVRRQLRAQAESSILMTPGIRDLRWGIPGRGIHPLNLDTFFSGGGSDPVNSLIFGTFLYNENVAQLISADQLWDRYTFLYGLTNKGLKPFAGDKDAWERLGKLTSELGKGATLNRWMTFLPTDPYLGAERGDSDGAVPIVSMTGGYAGTSATRVSLGDVDHEEYFGAPKGSTFTAAALGKSTATQTFTSMDFGNSIYNCPSITVTQPNASGSYGDTDKVPVDAQLVWPGDQAPGLRVREILIKDSSGDRSFRLSGNVQPDGHITGDLQADQLGKGGPAFNGMRIVVVFLDGTELETFAMTGAVFSWKDRVYLTIDVGGSRTYFLATCYECAFKAEVSAPITKVRDAATTFTDYAHYWMIDAAANQDPIRITGSMKCSLVGSSQGSLSFPNNTKMDWIIRPVRDEIFDGTNYVYQPIVDGRFDLRAEASQKNWYLEYTMAQDWGAAVNGATVHLSSGGFQRIGSLVLSFTRK